MALVSKEKSQAMHQKIARQTAAKNAAAAQTKANLVASQKAPTTVVSTPTTRPSRTPNPATVDVKPVLPSRTPNPLTIDKVPGYDPTYADPKNPIPGQPGYKGTTGGQKPNPMPQFGMQTADIAPDGLASKITGDGGSSWDYNTGARYPNATAAPAFKKGGKVKSKAKSSYSSGGKVSSASKRGDGCAQRGKTKGRMV